jgi:ferric-dicitrate binding protein FerR (iron transport regulator)
MRVLPHRKPHRAALALKQAWRQLQQLQERARREQAKPPLDPQLNNPLALKAVSVSVAAAVVVVVVVVRVSQAQPAE